MRSLRYCLCVLGLTAGCGEKPSSTAPSAAQATVSPSLAPSGSASPAVVERPAPSAPASSTSASAPPAASVGPTAPAQSASSAVGVQVANIGLHIGGGPNDAVTKEPILRSVAPHFDAFRTCFAAAEGPKKGGDFGVDLLVEAGGGPAKVTHPRTVIAGEAFRSCVVSVFEKIDFQKPRGGRTMASYSLHFTPR